MKIKLNEDQENLVHDMNNFMNNDEKYFLLSGQAGVGKTTCVRYFVEKLLQRKPNMKICLSAPTNKATGVIKAAVANDSVTYKTIYSLLGLRMMPTGAVKELADSGKDSVSNYDVVVIDEGSMINTILIEYIYKKTALADTKIIIIGDKEQLPPVGEVDSPIWSEFTVDYELTEVMRHQNSILTFVQQIRSNPKPEFKSPGEDVHISTEDEFMEEILKCAQNGEFHTGKAKAIAWRNMTVEFLNTYIRSHNRLTASPLKYTKGDRIVVTEPIHRGEELLASTDDEGIVLEVNKVSHTLYTMLTVWKLKLLMENGTTIIAHVIHEDSADMLKKMLDMLGQQKRWDKFWKLKDAFNVISYSYALTSHRSQGSTFEKVFIDAGDIMLNRSVIERTRCLYVACSRASKKLYVFP